MCDHAVIACKDENCCGTSCNGGGCDLCHDDFVEAMRMVNEGLAPPKEILVVKSKKEDIDKLFQGNL